MRRLAGFLGHHLEVWLAHVGTDEPQAQATFRAEPAEKPEQGFHRPLLSNPQQPLAVTELAPENETVA
jgi:hypothetical protein